MQNSQFHYLESKKVKLTYLGELTSNKAILFLGRGNQEKNSKPLRELLDRMALSGHLLVWPESREQSINKFLTKKSEKLLRWLDWVFGQNKSLLKNNLQRFVKGLALILYPSKWDFFLTWCINSGIASQTKLARQSIKMLGKNKSVSILSHSAGGIAASNLGDEENLKNIICFGYPFKHPDKEDERYRTINLEKIRIPFLIIQGNRDEYGGLGIENQHELSPYIDFIFVDATHEYENLSTNDWIRVSQRIELLLEI
jgi:hypothetical protein